MQDPVRILVCPLNWGLGHASRDVPLIQKLLGEGHEVILAGDGAPLKFLETEFPHLALIPFPAMVRITYFRHLPAWLKIFIISPFLLYQIIFEHLRLKKIIKIHRPDLVISDNRYGLWSPKIKCILITHQCSFRLPVPLRFLEYPAARLLQLFIEKFDRCWIPDYPGKQNLTGDLSHRFPLPANAEFIGPLSRFAFPGNRLTVVEKSQSKAAIQLPDPTLIILISGPEPQRTSLEKIILKQIPGIAVTTLILQGLPEKNEAREIGPGHFLISHLPSASLEKYIKKARYVICRSGYSSIMDLVKIRKKALLIPTPGQPEQEYLAAYLSRKGIFLSCRQQELNLQRAVQSLEQFETASSFPEQDYLKDLLSGL